MCKRIGTNLFNQLWMLKSMGLQTVSWFFAPTKLANFFRILKTSVPDPNPDPTDPYVFWPPGSGSGSTSQRYGPGSFYHDAKIVRKTLIPTLVDVTSFGLFIFREHSWKQCKKNIFSRWNPQLTHTCSSSVILTTGSASSRSNFPLRLRSLSDSGDWRAEAEPRDLTPPPPPTTGRERTPPPPPVCN